jgi:cbb3-type cytochrome oxidase maturation protein
LVGGGGDVGVVFVGDLQQFPGADMTVILWLIAASLFLGGCGLAVFLWSLRTGQYEDLDGAATRILFDHDPPKR